MKAALTFISFLLSTVLFSQKLSFDVYLFGNVIGHTGIVRQIMGDTLANYKLHSHSEAYIFFTHRTSTLDYDVSFLRGKLIHCTAKNVRNDESHLVTITCQNNSYLIVRDGEQLCFKPDIIFSSIQLYYEEPKKQKEVFSERLGEYRPMKCVAPHEYEVDMKGGITYTYRYGNGKLLELEMRKGLLGSAYLRPHKS